MRLPSTSVWRAAFRRALPPLGVALLAALAFAAVVPGGKFVFDDHGLIERNSQLVQRDVWWSAFMRDYYTTSERRGDSGYYRPVAVLTNAADVHLWRGRKSGYHLTNLILHAAASATLGPALAALGVAAPVAWVSALLFAVHPAHAESVAFVSGRVDVLAGLGVFLVLALVAARWRGAGLALGLAAFLAFLSKEITVVLPLLVLIAWMARPRTAEGGVEEGTGPSRATLAVAIGTAALVALLLRRAVLGAWLPTSAGWATPTRAWLLPLQTILFALASLYAPLRRLALEPDPAHLPALRLVVGVAVAAGLWVAAWRADPEARPSLRRCAWAGGLALLPVLNLLPQETVLSERFLYLASGFWLVPAGVLAVAGWRRGGLLQPITAGACALAVVLLFGISAWRARAWREDVVLWRIAVQEEPDRAAFWDRLGLALTEKREFAPAEEALRRAVALQPNYFNAQLNLGALLQATHRQGAAIEAYRKALALQPKHVNAHLNIGLSLMDMGNLPAAYAEFEAAVALKPDNPDALRLAGGCALQMNKLEDSRRYLEAAEQLLPQNPAIQQLVRLLEERERRKAAGAGRR